MRATILAFTLAFAACGGDDLDGPWKNKPVTGGTTLGKYCDDVGAVACKRSADCGGPGLAVCLEQFKLECCSGTATCARTADALTAADLTSQCTTVFTAMACDVAKVRVSPDMCTP